jgi:hypothetical protein
MKRREFTRNQREEIVERSKRGGKDIRCEGCGQVLGAKAYEIDHIIAEALRPEADKQKRLTIAEGQLLGKCCHRGEDGKTNKDVKAIAEAKRRYDRANGLKRPKQTIQSKNDLRTRPERDPNKGLPPLPRRKLYEERP